MDHERMKRMLFKLSLVFPFMEMGPDELKLAADMWMEDLGHVSEPDFDLAVRMHRANSGKFPTPNDIKKNYESIIDDRRRKTVQIPDNLRSFDEQAEINSKGIAAVRAALGKAKNKNGLKV